MATMATMAIIGCAICGPTHPKFDRPLAPGCPCPCHEINSIFERATQDVPAARVGPECVGCGHGGHLPGLCKVCPLFTGETCCRCTVGS